MKRILLATLLLSACGAAPTFERCEEPRAASLWADPACDRDHTSAAVKTPPAAPPEEPEEPGEEEPPKEPPPKACDGGARPCHDGEEPTGTVDNPTEYLK